MIRLSDLTLSHERHPAVHHLSGSFATGSMTAVVGPNGAGKTTLLRALAGLHPVDAGTLDRGALRPADIALLPQGSALDRSFPIACRDVVALGHAPRRGLFSAIGAADLARAEDALAAVGLTGFGTRPVRGLSAGQFQRVLFARLLVQDAPVMLLDEPFNAVDERTAADLMDVVRRWHGDGRTIVAVLHDQDLVRREFPDCLLLARHAIAWGETPRVLSAENRLRARAMAEAWAGSAEVCAKAA